jgi:hypothetical protein
LVLSWGEGDGRVDGGRSMDDGRVESVDVPRLVGPNVANERVAVPACGFGGEKANGKKSGPGKAQ